MNSPEQPPSASGDRPPVGAQHAAFLAAAILGTFADLFSKHLAFPAGMYENPFLAPRTEVIPGIFAIQCSWNSGALFGIGQGMGLVFIVLSIAAVVVVPVLHLRLARVTGALHAFGLGAIEAGALGNLYDRLRYGGRVRDFLDLHWGRHYWPTFNIADALICAGLAALLLSSFKRRTGEARGTPPA
jgi:signal peptidase II